MLHKGNYIKRLMKKLNVRQEHLTDKSDPRYVGFGRNTLINLLKNEEFIKEDDMARARTVLDAVGASEEDYNFVFPPRTTSNAREIGIFTDGDDNTPMREISPGYYLLTAELVPIHAQAGYLLGYQDQEYIEALPKYTTTVDRFALGSYRFFEASGDSMNNGNVEEAIPDGTILMCREIKRDHWSSKLHTHNWPSFVFVHRTEGIVVKQIAHQDLKNGVLVLRSLNPDKDKYPDFEVHMDDLLQIFNVVKRILDK